MSSKSKLFDLIERFYFAGKPLYSHTAWSYTQSKRPKKQAILRKVQPRSLLNVHLLLATCQSNFAGFQQVSKVQEETSHRGEEACSTPISNIEESDMAILESAFRKKLSTQASTRTNRMVRALSVCCFLKLIYLITFKI